MVKSGGTSKYNECSFAHLLYWTPKNVSFCMLFFLTANAKRNILHKIINSLVKCKRNGFLFYGFFWKYEEHVGFADIFWNFDHVLSYKKTDLETGNLFLFSVYEIRRVQFIQTDQILSFVKKFV